MRTLLYRPLLLAILLVGLGLVSAMFALVGASWRSLHRLQAAHQRLSHLGALQQAAVSLERMQGSVSRSRR
jgi:hypothetical protein